MMAPIYNLAITFMFVQYALSDWRVYYKTFQEGSSNFKDESVSCGVKFIGPSYSGFGIRNDTKECYGLERGWMSDPQLYDGHLSMIKTIATDVYVPPLIQHRPIADPFLSSIPGVLSTNSHITVVFEIPATLKRLTLICNDESANPSVSFRMRIFTRESNNPTVRFVHTVDKRDIDVEEATLFPYSVDTLVAIQFVVLNNTLQIYVDSTHFYDWTHRHPPDRFDVFRIWLPNIDDLYYLHSVSMAFSHL